MLPRCGLHCECDFLCYMLSSVPEWGTTTRSDQSVASHLRIVAHGKFVNFPWQTVLANESISLWKFENLYQIGGWGCKDPAWFSLQNAARYMVSWSKLKPGAYDVIAWLPHTSHYSISPATRMLQHKRLQLYFSSYPWGVRHDLANHSNHSLVLMKTSYTS